MSRVFTLKMLHIIDHDSLVGSTCLMYTTTHTYTHENNEVCALLHMATDIGFKNRGQSKPGTNFMINCGILRLCHTVTYIVLYMGLSSEFCSKKNQDIGAQQGPSS